MLEFQCLLINFVQLIFRKCTTHLDKVIKYPDIDFKRKIHNFYDRIFFGYSNKYSFYLLRKKWKFRIYKVTFTPRYKNTIIFFQYFLIAPRLFLFTLVMIEAFIIGEIKYFYLFFLPGLLIYLFPRLYLETLRRYFDKFGFYVFDPHLLVDSLVVLRRIMRFILMVFILRIPKNNWNYR
jgi:hypothetical protein